MTSPTVAGWLYAAHCDIGCYLLTAISLMESSTHPHAHSDIPIALHDNAQTMTVTGACIVILQLIVAATVGAVNGSGAPSALLCIV